MRIFISLLLVLIASGCGGNCPEPGAGGTCKPPCSDIALAGSPITPSWVMENPPPFSGDTILDGMYVLTSATIYSGPKGGIPTIEPIQVVYRFSGGKLDNITTDMGGAYTQSGTFTTGGNSLTLALACGGTGAYVQSYSATRTTLTLGQDGGTVGPILTLTKQ
jgi:hypothetical protein